MEVTEDEVRTLLSRPSSSVQCLESFAEKGEVEMSDELQLSQTNSNLEGEGSGVIMIRNVSSANPIDQSMESLEIISDDDHISDLYRNCSLQLESYVKYFIKTFHHIIRTSSGVDEELLQQLSSTLLDKDAAAVRSHAKQNLFYCVELMALFDKGKLGQFNEDSLIPRSSKSFNTTMEHFIDDY